MLGAYEQMYGKQPRRYSSLLEKNDHPEIDDSKELIEEDITKYQSMIGALQWAITLGRFDVLAAIMTMSRFQAEPRTGHLHHLKRIYGYLRKYKHGAICSSMYVLSFPNTHTLNMSSMTGCILYMARSMKGSPKMPPNC